MQTTRLQYGLKILKSGRQELSPAIILYKDTEGTYRRQDSKGIMLTVIQRKPIVILELEVDSSKEMRVHQPLIMHLQLRNVGEVPIRDIVIPVEQVINECTFLRGILASRISIDALQPKGERSFDMVSEAILPGQKVLPSFQAEYSDVDGQRHNVRSEPKSINVLERKYELVVDIQTSKGPYSKGDPLNIFISVRNQSPHVVQYADVSLAISEDFENIEGTRWTIHDLQPNDEREFDCQVIPKHKGKLSTGAVNVSYESSTGEMHTFQIQGLRLEVEGEVLGVEIDIIRDLNKEKKLLDILKTSFDRLTEEYNDGQLSAEHFTKEQRKLKQMIVEREEIIKEKEEEYKKAVAEQIQVKLRDKNAQTTN